VPYSVSIIIIVKHNQRQAEHLVPILSSVPPVQDDGACIRRKAEFHHSNYCSVPCLYACPVQNSLPRPETVTTGVPIVRFVSPSVTVPWCVRWLQSDPVTVSKQQSDPAWAFHATACYIDHDKIVRCACCWFNVLGKTSEADTLAPGCPGRRAKYLRRGSS